MKKRILYIFIGLLIFFTIGYEVHAASLSIWSSTKSITNGGSVSITVKADGLAGKFSITSSNGSVLSGGTSSVWLENESKTYKFSAKSIGSATINVTPIDVSDSSGKAYSGSKSITINVVKPREKSSNNNLKGLGIDGHELTPSFNKDTLEYSVELPADATKINIYANKEDGYASVSGAGEKDVIEGDNRFEITVTSETGKSKTYVINANVKDNNPIIVSVDNKELTVVKRADSLTKPNEEYIDKKVTISEIEIPAFYNEKNNITLIGLKDEKGIISLYKYDEENKKYSKYEELISKSITVISEKVTNVPDDYKVTTIKIDDKEYTVYKNAKDQSYSLIYGLNLETGKKNWYRYDEEEKTLQIYDNSNIESLIKEYEEKESTYKLLIIGLGTLTILLLIIVLVLVLKKSKNRSKVESIKAKETKKNKEEKEEESSSSETTKKSKSKQKSK